MIFPVFSCRKIESKSPFLAGRKLGAFLLSVAVAHGVWNSQGAEGRPEVLFGNLIGASSDLIWRAKSCIQKFRQVPNMEGRY